MFHVDFLHGFLFEPQVSGDIRPKSRLGLIILSNITTQKLQLSTQTAARTSNHTQLYMPFLGY
jgi:hypothetical protein